MYYFYYLSNNIFDCCFPNIGLVNFFHNFIYMSKPIFFCRTTYYPLSLSHLLTNSPGRQSLFVSWHNLQKSSPVVPILIGSILFHFSQRSSSSLYCRFYTFHPSFRGRPTGLFASGFHCKYIFCFLSSSILIL